MPALCISVTFLSEEYRGEEWPPSPARLFQALVATARTGRYVACWSDREEGAMRWLEERQPPTIIAPRASRGTGFSAFGPADTERLAQAWAKGERVDERRYADEIPVHRWLISEGTTVHYLWSIENEELERARGHIETLKGIADRLLALGWGTDHVVGWCRLLGNEEEIRRLEGIRFVPTDEFIDTTLQVPRAGFLTDVLRHWEESRLRAPKILYLPRKPVPAEKGYRDLGRTGGPRRRFSAFEFVGADPAEKRPSVRWEDTMVVSAWLRHAAAFALKGRKPDEWINTYVLGHGGLGKHFSFVPLSTIGTRYADGRIRRAMVMQTGEEWVEGLSRILAGFELTDVEGRSRCRILPIGAEDPVLTHFIGTGRIWASVTPAVLHGHDYRHGRFSRVKTEKLILQAFSESGYPAELIEEISFQKSPFWSGTGHVRDISLPSHLRRRPRYHVWAKFRVPVVGPVLVGLGQHYGIGVFARLGE